MYGNIFKMDTFKYNASYIEIDVHINIMQK